MHCSCGHSLDCAMLCSCGRGEQHSLAEVKMPVNINFKENYVLKLMDQLGVSLVYRV
jgi:hypothetical protein